MAQFLYDRDSTGKHLNATRRHMRKARQQKKNQYADLIKPKYDDLLAKQKATEEKNEVREDAYDDILMHDANLDDGVRNVFTAVQTHDRNNPADAVLKRVFPDQKFGDIVKAPLFKEPDLVEQVAIRIESLGESHPLYSQAAYLRERISASRLSIAAYEQAIRDVKFAEADEEIAQANLRRQYELNYYQCSTDYNKTTAERIFPQLTKPSTPMQVEVA